MKKIALLIVNSTIAFTIITAQASGKPLSPSENNQTNRSYIEWLQGNWGEVSESGEPLRGACRAKQNLEPDFVGKLKQKVDHREKKMHRRYPGLLAFSTMGSTSPNSVFISSGYPDIVANEGSLIQTYYSGKATTKEIAIFLKPEGDFISYYMIGKIPGISYDRKVVPISNNQFKLVTTDKDYSDYMARELFFVRCT